MKDEANLFRHVNPNFFFQKSRLLNREEAEIFYFIESISCMAT